MICFAGLFRKVATSAMRILRQEAPRYFHGLQDINRHFLSLGPMHPTLTLQWCNVLILLNIDDQSLWSDIMQTPKKYIMASPR
jgi:huntingtin